MSEQQASQTGSQAVGGGQQAPATMFCRDCRAPLYGQGRGRCSRCGRPFNSHIPRTYVVSAQTPKFVWYGVISWSFFLVAQVYGGLIVTYFGSSVVTWTPYLGLQTIGIVYGIRGAFVKPWLNQVISCIALMAYVLSLASLIGFLLR